jgi:glutathione S-transferase
MSTDSLTLYQSNGSPNARRVRIYLAERGLSVPMIAVDLAAKAQFSDAYKAINPRSVVPTLVLGEGTAIGEVPAIWRYLEEAYPGSSLLGSTPKDKALVTMWERRVEQEGFASAVEAVRNLVPGLKGRAVAGPHDYEQIPELVERSKARLIHFYADLDARLSAVPFVAGDHFSVADITAVVTADFAARAIGLPVPETHTALKRWYDAVSSRPSMTA